MKVYVFKISNENGKLKIELPEIPMGKQIDEVDLIAGLTTEFIASMLRDAQKDRRKFVIDASNQLAAIRDISKNLQLRKRRENG